MRVITVDVRSPLRKAVICETICSAGCPFKLGIGPRPVVRGWQPVQEVAPRGGAASAGAMGMATHSAGKRRSIRRISSAHGS